MTLPSDRVLQIHAALPQGHLAVEAIWETTPLPRPVQEDLLEIALEAGYADSAAWLTDRLGGPSALGDEGVGRCLVAVARGPHPEGVESWWAVANAYARSRAMGEAVNGGHLPTLHAILHLAQTTEDRRGWERAIGYALERGSLTLAQVVLDTAPSTLRASLQSKSVVEAVRHRRLPWILAQAPSVNLGLSRLQEALELAIESRQESVVPWLLSQVTSHHDLSVAMKHAVQAERLDWLQPQLDLKPSPATTTLAVRTALYQEGPTVLPLLQALLPHATAEAYKVAYHHGPLAALYDAQGNDLAARPVARLLAHWLAQTAPDILAQDMDYLLAYKSVHLYGEALTVRPTPEGYEKGVWRVLQRLEDAAMDDPQGAWLQDHPEGLQALLRQWIVHAGPLTKATQSGLDRRFTQFLPATQHALVAHLGHQEKPEWKAVARLMELEQRSAPSPVRTRRRS